MSKRHEKNLALFNAEKKYMTAEAFGILEKFAGTKFDETINVAFRLGVDVKQADQQVRGATTLPNGLGKKVRVVVFAKGAKVQEAQDAGADFVGADDLVQKITEGWLDFDKVIATPDMMATISKVSRILGPRGLMPNPKLGTVTLDVTKAINEERKGKIEFRAEKAGIVHAPIGKKSFGAKKLQENFDSLVDMILRLKPAAAKGTYLKSVTLSGSMSPGIRLEVSQFTSTVKE
ncbi:MAG: 50S ribosomal protein L1 [Bdellovibrionota bacterium]